MPESGAVYQPTTVGYSYDTRDGGLGIRRSFSRIMARHKFSTRSWLEWVLFTVALAAFTAGLTMMLVNVFHSGEEVPQKVDDETPKDSETAVKERHENEGRASIAAGASMMVLGIGLGILWGYMRFFRHGKLPRGGMTGNSGQYGPVLTELPSQMKASKIDEVSTALPMSDQEEETHTLMDDVQLQPAGGPSTIAGQIPG
ncbi:uncharacterized protein LOC106654431 isoform X2 [Trichogramma pretiosum]|uniref:uncharacterized protein LOC106654431 isoform X2 n=1 Tax=Trichogramma pretiosum TaxID=7493 RepID=UPI0006C9E546|nr:uncharacterized protein LOC106654431 isoform X2 [Trichogramma pretiosum]